MDRYKGLTDVQSMRDTRNIPLNRVGIKNIRYPITVLDKVKGRQHTVANVNMYVNLPHQFKGTHMSRFIEILNEYRREITIQTFEEILSAMKERLNSQEAHLEIDFPYFIEKSAPITGVKGLMEYSCGLHGTMKDELDMMLIVKVPVTTVCPCSKEISDFGAHNQRGEVRVWVRFKRFLWLEDVIEVVEGCGSSQVYSVLKRPDEKFVTEEAFKHPVFVEDMVRAVYEGLKERPEITWFAIEAENFESIHNHSAYAYAVYPG